MAIPNDEDTLIASARRGSLEAFNQLVLAHQDRVYTLAYRLLGDRERAADAAQDAFILAYRRLATYRGGSFRAWLLRIVTNRCYDDLRRAQRQTTVRLDDRAEEDPEPFDPPDPGSAPEQIAIQRELQRAVQRCIDALNADQRLVLVLCDIEGLSYDALASQLPAQIGTVKSRLSRARASVRDCLQAVRELLPAQYRLQDKS